MANTCEAVVAGHLCLDIYPDLSHSAPDALAHGLLPGRLIEGGPMRFYTGGAVSNTGLALVRLGIQTHLCGRIGDDLLGQAVRRVVATYGESLLEGLVVDPEVDTSYTLVFSPPDVDRSFIYYAGANADFGMEHVDWAAVTGSRLFHFGYPPTLQRMFQNNGAELESLYQRAKKTGATTSLDMTLPDSHAPAGLANWTEILTRTLPSVDIFVPSLEEALYSVRRSAYEALRSRANGDDILSLVDASLLSSLGQQLVDMGASVVGFKLGHRGLYLRTGSQSRLQGMGRARPADVAGWANREIWAPSFKVDVAGTTGAGDAAYAGFLTAMLKGMSPEQAVTAAVAVGACNVEVVDSLGGVRSWEDTWERVCAGWPRRELLIEDEGWSWEAPSAVWQGPAGN